MSKVLIVDDDVTFCLMLDTFLQKKGFEVQQSFSYAEAIKKIKSYKPDIILTDLRLPDHDGLEVMHFALRESAGVPVILMTGYADIRTAVQAMKLGAFDYVAKPVNPDEIIITINRALSQSGVPDAAVAGLNTESFFVEGTSPAALKISDYVRLVAPTGMSVLIMGESGTGKEFVARKIHQLSTRSDKPFVAIDCGALPRDLAGSEFFGHLKGSFTGAFADKQGQFEAANGGTIFLDEIGNLGYDIQVQLLRAIQERKVRRIGSTSEIPIDVRIITATNDDLKKSVVTGEFREDLYHRINEFAIQVSPLRDRHDDLIIFTRHFLDLANKELSRNVEGFSSEVIDIFSRYSWPGNFRELKNIIKRAVLLSTGGIIMADTLPEELIREAELREEPLIKVSPAVQSTGMNLKETAHRSERELILSTLEKVRFNKSKAAILLNIDRKTLYNKMKQFGIPLQ